MADLVRQGVGEDDEEFVGSTAITDEHRALAQALADRHGATQLAVESSGVHAYMASPECLDQFGSVELMKKHLAVNLDKYLKGIDLAAQCMKTGKAFRVSRLLKWAPLAERGFKKSISKVTQAAIDPDALEDDGKGNMIPRHPGEVTPIIHLPKNHVAVDYLAERGFTNLFSMWLQCRLSWCTQENPKTFWKPLRGGFRATPQNRLIFYVDIHGVQRAWQGRILDKQLERKGEWWYLHPYTNEWVLVKSRNVATGEWVDNIPPVPDVDEKWDPRKYLFPPGSRRNQLVMGLDAAIMWNRGRDRRVAILVEGPLDMCRFGPPAIATMGKYFSEEQAKLITDNFDEAVYVADNDEGGDIGCKRVHERLRESAVRLRFEDLPAEFKDAGSMRDDQAKQFLVDRIFVNK